ncbi:hypothetical protein [Frondihabitans cladoniiphilus]|uniref:Fibronectin type-III domain-containing protein n=1 Tax=Frondihabitans cladoniiphilus TaxID=715785 RepID=A0ABP8VUR5_9MICO
MVTRRLKLAFGVMGVLALGIAGVVTAPMAAIADATVTNPVFAFDSGFSPLQTPHYPSQESAFAFGPDVTVDFATSSNIDMSVPGSDAGANTIQVTTNPGESIRAGVFTLTGNPNVPGPFVSVGGNALTGRIDVLDIASNAAGSVTRFDAVLLSYPENAGASQYGEIRFGETEPAVQVLQPHLEFAKTAVGGARVLAVEHLRNTQSTAVKVGTISVTGGATSDYTISHDACSGTTLAAGTTCSFLAGFSASKGGPRNATISVPVGSTTQTISATGSGAVGTNSITTTWPDDADHPVTQTEVNGPQYELAVSPTNSTGWDWYASQTYSTADLPDQVEFNPANGATTITVGTSPVQALQDVTNPYYDLGYPGAELDRPGESCSSFSGVRFGTETVHSFALGADGLPTMASIDLTGTCSGETSTTTAQLRWQVRSDVTAPAAVRSISMTNGTTRTVMWAQSTSKDTSYDVVRVVEGDGSGATPGAGSAVKFGLTTSAVLPSLRKGVAYTVVAFAVDGTGNVSAPAVAHIVG